MRTHIRMHFDKKTSDFNEENYITCILEEDGLEIPPHSASVIQSNPENITSQQIHYCDMCSYKSGQKANLVSVTGIIFNIRNKYFVICILYYVINIFIIYLDPTYQMVSHSK